MQLISRITGPGSHKEKHSSEFSLQKDLIWELLVGEVLSDVNHNIIKLHGVTTESKANKANKCWILRKQTT